MYATCLYCNHRLGGNEVIEPFPVGRRVAFDAARGRLWVVCRSCERWNLTPFEQRWEAVEHCERRFRDARKRVTSENVGLARLDEGLELVRIGEPLRPEFASWRYGDQFGRRRRRTALAGAGVAAAGGLAVVGGAALGAAALGGIGLYQLIARKVRTAWERRLVARVPTHEGETLTVLGEHLAGVRLRPDFESEDGWSLELPHAEGTRFLRGTHALNAVALTSPKVNWSGAPPLSTGQAVKLLERFDNPEQYLLAAAHVAEGKGPGHKVLAKLPARVRLAVEMAAHEENERIAMEGDLVLLELDWKEAEEIAAIADSLLIPAEVEEQLEELRRGDKPRFYPRRSRPQ
jgi:hypothetical protein